MRQTNGRDRNRCVLSVLKKHIKNYTTIKYIFTITNVSFALKENELSG